MKTIAIVKTLLEMIDESRHSRVVIKVLDNPNASSYGSVVALICYSACRRPGIKIDFNYKFAKEGGPDFLPYLIPPEFF